MNLNNIRQTKEFVEPETHWVRVISSIHELSSRIKHKGTET